jgi:hypothetical protein
MSEYFILFISLSGFVQIGYVRHQIVDKMQYYHSDFFQELVWGLGLDWCKFVQNGKTLGQFFELL